MDFVTMLPCCFPFSSVYVKLGQFPTFSSSILTILVGYQSSCLILLKKPCCFYDCYTLGGAVLKMLQH